MDHKCSPNSHAIASETKYGERYLHLVFDDICSTEPDRLYASVDRSTDSAADFIDLTFRDIAHCVHVFASTLEGTIGRSSTTETVAYLGLPDVRNVVVFLAAVKCGYKLLFLSPRNQPSTSKSLLEQTECNTLIHAVEMAPLFHDLETSLQGLRGIQVAELEELQRQEHQPFLYDGPSQESMRKPILILHSSGSTGVPKPITMTNGTFATFDYCRNLPTVQGRQNNDFSLWDSNSVRKFYSAFPPSHLAGFLSLIIIPIFSETSCPVLGPPLRPPSGQLVREIMTKQELRSLFIPPAVAEQILQEPDGLEFFRGLDFMYTAGGPLSHSAGDLISSVTSVCQLYGSTETSQIPMLVPLPEDWAYMEFHPSLKLELRPMGSDDGICELVHYVDESTEKIAALNHNFPGITEYPTRDLFMPHPTKAGLWRFHGRVDDVIVLSNGEKFFPVPMEIKLSGHPSLSGALVLGQGRFQAALLLEPKKPAADAKTFIETLWPFIEEANLLVPGQGRITRSKVLLTSSDKPFQRAPKGTIVRSLILKAYDKEISALYVDDVPKYSVQSVPTLKATYEGSTVEDWVRSIVLQTFPLMHNASNTEDMFVMGLDSLKTMDMLGMLKAALSNHKDTAELHWLTVMIIYSNPTIERLARRIGVLLNSESAVGIDTSTEATAKQRTKLISSFVERYTQGLTPTQERITSHTRLSADNISSSDGFVVAVTGTTGSLGRQLLQRLIQDSRITKIVCLDRGQNARQKHRHLDGSKLEYSTTKLSEPNLGLSKDAYILLRSEVDVIIHNAWKVDFTQILESYEADHIHGVKRLIDWSLSSTKHPRIVFISSISSVSSFSPSPRGSNSSVTEVPETIISDTDAPAHMGYAESKLTAELILAVAAEKANLPISILRVGQIAGSTSPTDPPWPNQEWFPSLVKTSKAIGLLPRELPPIDWVPIDKLALSIIQITSHDINSAGMEIYNLVNPHPVPWEDLNEVVKARCGSATQEVPLQQWLDHLKALPANISEAESKPALKIIGFFEQMAKVQAPKKFDTRHSESVSRTMASMRPVNQEWMRIWLDQWQF